MRIASIVLAGGKNRRLGRCKALEPIGGKTLIERVVERLEPLTGQILIVTSREQLELPVAGKAEIMIDIYPDRGPLGGIYTGLLASQSLHSLVVACDMPFLNQSLLQFQMNLAPGFDVVVPFVDKYLEPLHAVYSKNCLPHIERILKDGGRSVLDLMPQVNVGYVLEREIEGYDPDYLSFFNLNTEANLEKARAIVNGEKVREVMR